MDTVRKVKTGTDEAGNDTYEVQFGGEYDGVFIPFVTKSLGYVEHLAEREKARQESESEDYDAQPSASNEPAPDAQS